MRELNLKSAREVLEATAAVLVALGGLATEDEELLDSLSAATAFVLGVRDMLEGHPEVAEAMMGAFLEAYESGLINKLDAEGPQGEA